MTNENIQKLKQFTVNFAEYVKQSIKICIWSIIGSACLAATFVSLFAIWRAIKIVMQAIGIQ